MLFGRNKRIYLDYASLTPIDRRVIQEMNKYSSDEFANPSSIYKEGVNAKKALAQGREMAASFIHAHADEIFFTSGGTESNALALEGAGRAARNSGIEKPHLIISSVEHSSIMETASMLEKHGVEVTRLNVDSYGLVSLDELKKSLKKNTYLVSIMSVNNEIGTVQPIREIAKIVRQFRQSNYSIYPLIHTDAAQGSLYQELNMEKIGIDLLSMDGGKIYGPRGMGILYIRRGTAIESIIYGGGQEKGLRSGTENLPAIMGFAKALEIADKEREEETARLSGLKEYFLSELKKINTGIVLNGSLDAEKSSPHILNVSIPGIDNEFFVLRLDAAGMACSTKSSCLRDEYESYVLRAIGGDSKTSVRFSFGRNTKRSEIKKTIEAIASTLK